MARSATMILEVPRGRGGPPLQMLGRSPAQTDNDQAAINASKQRATNKRAAALSARAEQQIMIGSQSRANNGARDVPKFKVLLTRQIQQECTIWIDAKDAEEACELAQGQQDAVWRTTDTEPHTYTAEIDTSRPGYD
jgi:hypothetical protein